MTEQGIKDIPIEDLVLWTENPRDPIDDAPRMTDQEMADHATRDGEKDRWKLNALIKQMGKRYDLSELPTVVYDKDRKPIVYDGNRRVLIGKIIHGLVEIEGINVDSSKLDFPEAIPCNVCDKDTALDHIYRKHANTRSWGMLEQAYFRHKQRGEAKSPALIVNEATGIISENKELNKKFVETEILTEKNLNKIGFSTDKGLLQSQYKKNEDAIAVLNDIVERRKRKEISTRMDPRGDIMKVLDKKLLNKPKKRLSPLNIDRPLNVDQKDNKEKLTPVIEEEEFRLFGDKLALKGGIVNNLYRDLCQLHGMIKKETGWSKNCPAITHLGLRFIAEQAAVDKFPKISQKQRLGKYIRKYYSVAEDGLSEKEKEMLYTQKVTDFRNTKGEDAKERLIKLLNGKAHAYTSQNNDDQAIAISLILGQMLKASHGKKQK